MNRTNRNIFFLLILPVSVFSQNFFPVQDAWKHEAHFIASGRDSVFILPNRFLLPGSLVVAVDSLVQQEWSYRVDWNAGRIDFLHPPDSGKTIRMIYRSLPVRLQTEYSRWTSIDTLQAEKIQTPAKSIRRPKAAIAPQDELQRSGSIFRGITFGTNQGMRLESGLRLQVSGKIAPNVEVVASLTDQNTPIQPEGNTQTLQEIDKVFIQMKAPHFLATLGDFVFEQTGTQFGSYSRKLQGAMSSAVASRGSVTLLASASKGEFTNNHFQGQEGNQGPYPLTGSSGQRDIIVLAGTERVFIDGELMARGEDNDYIIEYDTGQITFTRKRLITGDSRISVDFEFSDQKFQKGIYGAAGEGKFWKERIHIRTWFVRESDNKDNPIDLTLTDETKRILERAGDHPDSAAISGAQFAGAQKGNYTREDSAGQAVYRYAGQGQGDYSVLFSYAGTGKGDYSFQGYGIYRYEGPGRGAYLPVFRLPMPRTHQIADAAASFRIGEGILAESEMSVSALDLNQFSSKDDQDNNGSAIQASFRMSERKAVLAGKTFGVVSLEGRFKNIDDRFRPLSRISEVEYGRKWGTEEGIFWGENTREFKGTYSPFNGLRVSGETGSFRRGSSFRSERTSAGLEWNRPKYPGVQYYSEWIRTNPSSGQNGFWQRQNGKVEASWKAVRPRFTYSGELRRDDFSDTLRTGFRFDEFGASAAVEKKNIRFELEEQIRDDRQFQNNRLEKYSLAETQQAALSIRGVKLNASFLFTHRNRNYTDPALEDQKTNLADMKLGFSLLRRFVDGSLNYQFSSTQVSEMVRDTIRVGQGLGNYRYDSQMKELVPDPDGDILYRTVQTGTFLPVNDLKAGADFRADGSKLFRKEGKLSTVFGRMSSRSLIRIERRDREKNFGSVNRSAFAPDWGADPDAVSGIISILEDLEYSLPKNRLFIRTRFRKDDSESRQMLEESLIRHALERSLQLKGNPMERLGFLVEYENKRDNKDYTSGNGISRDILSNGVSGELSYRPKQILEFAVKAKFKGAEDAFPKPHSKAVSVFLLPRVTYSIRERGQLRTELELGSIRVQPSGRALPYEMFNGDQPGKTIRASMLLTYKVAGHVMTTVSYRLRKEPWQEKTYQTAQIEARAFF